MENVIWLKDLNKNDVEISGVKGAYLADLYNKNFPVPNGFVVSTDAFKEFMESNNISSEVKKILKNLNFENIDEVGRASEKIKNLIMRENISKLLESEIFEAYENLNVNEDVLRASSNVLSLIKSGRSNAIVSVRSSSVFDLPGACSNFLGILGSKNLINSVKECWSSLYSVGNILNMKKNNTDNSLAVLVQKLVDTNKSGIVLSSNPMNRENEMIIEAAFGLGQLITRGEISPDIYLIDSNLRVKGELIAKKKLKLIRDLNTNEIVRKKLIEEREKRVLQAWEIEDISRLTQKIERVYDKPVIIEFGIGKKIEVFHVRLFDFQEIIDKDNLNGEILVRGVGGSPKINSGVVSNSEIIVCETADPRLVGMIDKVKGVVVNEGSLGSCLGILCRQLGVPFVIAENSTALLNRGLIVTVDGVGGKVYKGEVKEREEKIKIKDESKSYGFEVLDL